MSPFVESVIYWGTFTWSHSLFGSKRCANEPHLHTITSHLPTSSPAFPSAWTCTLNTLMPVVKLCFFLNVFLSMPPSLAEPHQPGLLPLPPQEPLAPPVSSNPHLRGPRYPQAKSKLFLSKVVPSRIGPQPSSLLDSFLTIPLCFWLCSQFPDMLPSV